MARKERRRQRSYEIPERSGRLPESFGLVSIPSNVISPAVPLPKRIHGDYASEDRTYGRKKYIHNVR